MQQLKSFLYAYLQLFLFLFLGQSSVWSQVNTYAFKTLTSDQGLVHNHVNCALRISTITSGLVPNLALADLMERNSQIFAIPLINVPG